MFFTQNIALVINIYQWVKNLGNIEASYTNNHIKNDHSRKYWVVITLLCAESVFFIVTEALEYSWALNALLIV